MITILPTKTPLEIRLAQIDEQLKIVENYAKGAAHALNSAMDVFWNTEDSLLLEILNSNGPLEMNDIFTAHANNAANINALLGERGIEPIALIGMRKPIKVNELGVFEMDYPVVEGPVVDPSPPEEPPTDPPIENPI